MGRLEAEVQRLRHQLNLIQLVARDPDTDHIDRCIEIDRLAGHVLDQPAGGSQPSITCPRCGTQSFHPEDIRHGYCARCQWWTRDSMLGSPWVIAAAEAQGAIMPLEGLPPLDAPQHAGDPLGYR